MKKNNFVETKITCACGAVFETKSNKPEMLVEVCSKCHPFYTGKQGSTLKKGKVDKFNQKYGLTEEN